MTLDEAVRKSLANCPHYYDRFYCPLAKTIVVALEGIPESKWPTPTRPSWDFHCDERIETIYNVPEGCSAQFHFHEPVADQDVRYEWGYWPSNSEENRSKAIAKFFNDPSSIGLRYFFLLPNEVKSKIKLASAQYDTWWIR